MVDEFFYSLRDLLPGSWRLAYAALAAISLSELYPSLRVCALAALAGCALVAWISGLRRRRLVSDTPTARIASAAQGYVQLSGRLQPFAGCPVSTPGGIRQCVWYRVVIEQYRDERWHTVSSEQSQESLLLVDDSGQCVVFWEGAEIDTPHRSVWSDAGYRHTEQWLAIGEVTTVLGEFHTQSGDTGPRSVDAEVRDLLDDWKRDPRALRKRFDRNGDGEISVEEWELARHEARSQVEARRQFESRNAGAALEHDTHIVRKPIDGRPFLIAARAKQALERRFDWLLALDLAVFVSSLVWLGQLLREWRGLH